MKTIGTLSDAFRILYLLSLMSAGSLSLIAENKNVWITDPPPGTQVSAQDMTVCVGHIQSFTAQTSWPIGGNWTWTGASSGGEAYPESYASKTFALAGGPYSVTATYSGTYNGASFSEESLAVRFTVVEVQSLSPSEGTLIAGSSPPTYVVCVGTGDVTATATPNPSLSESALPSCWSFAGGDAVGAGKLQRKISKSTPSITTFTCTAGSSSKSIKVVVFRTQMKSIEFTSDHGQLRDNNSDWTDTGSAYATPEWVSSPARNNPISQTKNTALTVSVTVQVEPSEVSFDLEGDGPDAYDHFVKTANNSTGADQVISITAGANLPNQVVTLSKAITWTIKAYGAVSCGTVNSGVHTIYVTYGTPSGGTVTEKRVSDVCSAANGQTSIDGCASAIQSHLNSFHYDLNGPNDGPSPIWLLHAGSPYSSQCPGLASFINKHFEMLGLGSGSIKYCRAMPDGTYAALDSNLGYWRLCTPGNSGHPDPTTHDDVDTKEWLMHLDGGGFPNHYEATCYFNSKHYAVGVGIYNTPKDVVKTSFGTINWFYSANNPPTNVSGCAITPWVEAP